MMVSEQKPEQGEGRVVKLEQEDKKAVPSFLGKASSPEPPKPEEKKKPVPSFVSEDSSSSEPTPEIAGMDRKVKKKVWTLKRITSIGAVATFVGAVVYMAIFGDHSAKLNVQVERITISELARGPFQEFIVQRGTVLPIQTVYIDALEGGQVEEAFLEEGTIVKKGDPILRLSNPDLERRVLTQEAQLFEQITRMETTRLNQEIQDINRKRSLMDIELSLHQAERNYLKEQELFERKLSSEDDFAAMKDRYEHAQKLKAFMLETVHRDSLYRINELAALQKRAHSLQLQLDDVRRPLKNLVVRAPIDGQLSQLNADIGQLMGRGIRIGKVDRLDGFKMTAGVDEFYITRVTTGLKGTIDIDDKIYELRIRRVFPEVTDGQFEVDLDFVGKTPEEIRTGQTEQIRLELDDPEEALLLARGGFYQTTGGNWVFVVEDDEAVRRDVRIGRQNPEYFEVLEGLVPGERVVTSSYENYEEIDKLILQQ
ncbi:MAG: HlyD family efflux transporter periplasmic adaptor subunit [Candidatus Latescibacteria bacterium]|nr:HlyD family efflux transporter periplasmic adaptor subunit [Candidatus Latescibacterota bacterium]